MIMKTYYQCLDVVTANVKRLNNLRLKGRLNKESRQEFLMYKNILKANNTGVYTKEVEDIIYS